MQGIDTGMHIERFQETQATGWDDLVQRSVNGTLMHLRRFLHYHPPDRFTDHSLCFTRPDGQLLGVFPAAEVKSPEGETWLQSHPGATYGGLVAGPRLKGESIYHAFRLLIEYARENRFAGIRMRLPETVFLKHPLGELDAALFEFGFQLEARELSVAVDLSGMTEQNLRQELKQEIRTTVNKALREGVVPRTTDDLASYWELLQENLRSRHQTRPTHTLDEILRLRDLLGDRIQFIGSYLDERLIAGVVLFQMTSHAAHTFYLAQDYQFQQHRPLTLAIYHTMKECLQRGVQHLNFGVCSVPGSRGHDMNWGLFDFKRRCGGDGLVRDTWIRRLDG